MISNKPKGIFVNKNAINIQLASLQPMAPNGGNLCDEPIKPLGLSTNHQQQPQAEGFKQDIIKTKQVHNLMDADILIEKHNLKSLILPTKVSNNDNNKQTFDENSTTNQFGASKINNKQSKIDGGKPNGDSPNEPKLPNLKSFSRNSLRQNLCEANQKQTLIEHVSNKLIDLDDHDLLKNPAEPESKSASPAKQKIYLPPNENNTDTQADKYGRVTRSNAALAANSLSQQQEANKSRIPRLSLVFPPTSSAQGTSLHPLSNVNVRSTTSKSRALASMFEKANKQKNALKLDEEAEQGEEGEQDENEDIEIEDIDKSTSRDAIYLVCDVAKDIYDYMFELEEAQKISQNYLKDQKIFTPKVRQRLINWCIDIHQELKLLPETMYMSIAVIDRFFDRFPVEQQTQVQLYAVASTLIASKYEEIYPPDVADLMYLTQNTYSKRDILRAEIFILKHLNFDLGKPIPLAFLRRFSKAAHCDVKMHSIAKYLMELSLNEHECAHWRPSLLAASALFTTLYLISGSDSHSSISNSGSNPWLPTLGRSRLSRQANSLSGGKLPKFERWNSTMVHYTHYTKKQLLQPSATLCKILRKAQKSPQSYTCVKKNLQSLSKWSELKSNKVDELIKIADQHAHAS